jgi:hypothetical protein
LSETFAPQGAETGLFYYHVYEYDPDGDGLAVNINPRDGSFVLADF